MICVGTFVRKDGNILAIRQARGHSLEGQWSIPWGRVEDGESPAKAAVREVMEEAGIRASIEGLVGVQELPEPWLGSFALLYLCSYRSGEPCPDGHETDAAAWLCTADIESMREPFEPWSRWAMLKVLAGEHTCIGTDAENPYAPSLGFI